MKIIVSNEEEKIAVNMLLQQISYTWDTNSIDGFHKAFEYINDRKECWDEDGNLIKDYQPILEKLLSTIRKTVIEIQEG